MPKSRRGRSVCVNRFSLLMLKTSLEGIPDLKYF